MRICLPPLSEIEEGGVVGVVFIGFLGFHVTRQDDSDYDNDNSICLTQFRWLPFIFPTSLYLLPLWPNDVQFSVGFVYARPDKKTSETNLRRPRNRDKTTATKSTLKLCQMSFN